MNKQRVFILIIHNPYQNIFQLTLKILPYFTVQLMLSCFLCILHILRFYFVKLFVLKNPLFENIFEKSLLHSDITWFITFNFIYFHKTKHQTTLNKENRMEE